MKILENIFSFTDDFELIEWKYSVPSDISYEPVYRIRPSIAAMGILDEKVEEERNRKILEITDWCSECFGLNRFKITWRGGKTYTFNRVYQPLSFEFVNVEDAVLFELTWGYK